MNQYKHLNELYNRNDKGEYKIEVFLDKYLAAFNEWDSAYLEVRELNPALIYFVERCSNDIPIDQQVELNFILSDKQDEDQEKLLIKALKSNFTYQLNRAKQSLHFLYKKSAKYFLISIAILLFAFSFEPEIQMEAIGDAFMEGLMIGGWVFLWQSISLFSFDKEEHTHKVKIFKRLKDSNIKFIYQS